MPNKRDISTFLIGLAVGVFFALRLSGVAPFYSFTWTYWVAWFMVVIAASGGVWLRIRPT